jgi:hypothetical protein
MFKIVALSSLILLSGCSVYNDRSIPTDVSIMPNDCANQRAILNWLEYQERQEVGLLSNKGSYAREQSAIKHKKWTIITQCNPID